jgi:hypothetical protein
MCVDPFRHIKDNTRSHSLDLTVMALTCGNAVDRGLTSLDSTGLRVPRGLCRRRKVHVARRNVHTGFMPAPGPFLGPAGDDRPGDDAALFTVPDDLRELEPDVAAYHRELRSERRRARFERLFKTRRWRNHGISGPIVIGVLTVVAAVGALLIAVHPNTDRTPPAQEPLAQTSEPAGVVGGLIPDQSLNVDGVTKSAQELRPALLALVPTGCECVEVLDSLAGQAGSYELRLYVVAPAASDPAMVELLSGLHRGQAVPAYDAGRVLAQTYDASGVTAVLLQSDGVVAEVVRDVSTSVQLGSKLSRLTMPS